MLTIKHILPNGTLSKRNSTKADAPFHDHDRVIINIGGRALRGHVLFATDVRVQTTTPDKETLLYTVELDMRYMGRTTIEHNVSRLTKIAE